MNNQNTIHGPPVGSGKMYRHARDGTGKMLRDESCRLPRDGIGTGMREALGLPGPGPPGEITNLISRPGFRRQIHADRCFRRRSLPFATCLSRRGGERYALLGMGPGGWERRIGRGSEGARERGSEGEKERWREVATGGPGEKETGRGEKGEE